MRERHPVAHHFVVAEDEEQICRIVGHKWAKNEALGGKHGEWVRHLIKKTSRVSEAREVCISTLFVIEANDAAVADIEAARPAAQHGIAANQ